MSPTGTRTSKSADSLDGKTEGITPRITRRHFPNTSFPSSPLPAAAPASPSGSSSSPQPPASQIPSAIPAPREPLSQSARTPRSARPKGTGEKTLHGAWRMSLRD